jgi:hypothetical protein
MSKTLTTDANDGHIQLYTTDLDVIIKEAPDAKSVRQIVFRIFIRQESDQLSSVRFQISSDDELDYLYEVTYTPATFEAMKARQRLDLDYADFPNVVRQQIIAVLRERALDRADQKLKVVLAAEDTAAPEDEYDGAEEEEEAEAGRKFFVIYQRLDFCRVAIFKFEFEAVPAERAARVSQARYDDLAARLKALETEYKDVYKRVQRTAPAALAGFKADFDDQA